MKYGHFSNSSFEGLISRGQYTWSVIQHTVCNFQKANFRDRRQQSPWNVVTVTFPPPFAELQIVLQIPFNQKIKINSNSLSTGTEASSAGCITWNNYWRVAVQLSLCTDLHPYPGFRIIYNKEQWVSAPLNQYNHTTLNAGKEELYLED